MSMQEMIAFPSHSSSDYWYYSAVGRYMHRTQVNTQHWVKTLYVKEGDLKLHTDDFTLVVRHALTQATEIKHRELVKLSDYGAILWELEGDEGIVEVKVDDITSNEISAIYIRVFEKYEGELYARVLKALLDSKYFVINKERKDRVLVNYAFPTSQGIDVITRNFSREWLSSIETNYDEQVIDDVQRLLKRMEEVTNGIIILRGPPGTGKTHLVRAILTESQKHRSPVVCNPPLQFLNDMGSLAQVMSRFKSSLIVLEDLGDVLNKSAPTEHVQVYANLLNITDGLLSLLSNSIVLMTFNTNIDGIDKAMLRPGRCLANIEVGSLSAQQAKKLLVDAGLQVKLTKSEYTLAEIYEIKRLGYIPEVIQGKVTKAGLLR